MSQISRLPVEEVIEESFSQVDENAPITVSNLLKNYFAVLVTKKRIVVGKVAKADLLRIL